MKLTDEDIQVVLDEEYPTENCGFNYNVKFLSLEGYDICWTKQEAEAVKQQILENAEIVKRLKDEIKLWNKIKPDSLFFIKELESILGESE